MKQKQQLIEAKLLTLWKTAAQLNLGFCLAQVRDKPSPACGRHSPASTILQMAGWTQHRTLRVGYHTPAGATGGMPALRPRPHGSLDKLWTQNGLPSFCPFPSGYGLQTNTMHTLLPVPPLFSLSQSLTASEPKNPFAFDTDREFLDVVSGVCCCLLTENG